MSRYVPFNYTLTLLLCKASTNELSMQSCTLFS
nr:MAG TPA: hypothetical protein [Caudoviricetes sp.]